jgi:hypothetical protein
MRATTVLFLAAVSLLAIPHLSFAQVPGEDPVVLQKKQLIQMLPLGNTPTSTAPTFNTDLPDWQRAKTSKYQAKAFNIEKGSVMTGEDVINTANDNGAKTSCTQSIASNVIPKGTTVRGAEQIVVLRGDLVNICN